MPVGLLKATGHRQHRGVLHLVGQLVGLGVTQPGALPQSPVKLLVSSQRGDIVGSGNMKIRCQFQTTLEQGYGLIQHTQGDSHLGEESYGVDIVGAALEVLSADSLGHPQATGADQIKGFLQQGIQAPIPHHLPVGLSSRQIVTLCSTHLVQVTPGGGKIRFHRDRSLQGAPRRCGASLAPEREAELVVSGFQCWIGGNDFPEQRFGRPELAQAPQGKPLDQNQARLIGCHGPGLLAQDVGSGGIAITQRGPRLLKQRIYGCHTKPHCL